MGFDVNIKPLLMLLLLLLLLPLLLLLFAGLLSQADSITENGDDIIDVIDLPGIDSDAGLPSEYIAVEVE